MRLVSRVAVALVQAGGDSSDSTPSLRTSTCRRNGPRNGKKTKNKQTKLKIGLPFDPAISLLGIYPEKTMAQKDTCIPMFIAALYTTAKKSEQTKC